MTYFHQHVNSICSHVQLAMEEEQSLSTFLECPRHPIRPQATHTGVQETDTDRYLHYNLHHTIQQNLAVAKLHNTNNHDQKHETSNIVSVLQLNGFLFRRSHKFHSKHLPTFYRHYIHTSVSEKIRRISSDVDIKLAMRPIKTVWKVYAFFQNTS